MNWINNLTPYAKEGHDVLITVRVRSFSGYKISRVSRTIPHPRNLILRYNLRTWPENVRMCVFMRLVACLVETTTISNAVTHPKGIGAGWISSDDGVTPINNPGTRITCWASSRFSRTMLVHGGAATQRRQDRVTAARGALARGLVYLSLMRCVWLIYAGIDAVVPQYAKI